MQTVDSVISINTQQNPNPHISKNAGRYTAGKEVSETSFAEYLRMHVSKLKEANASSAAHQADHKSVSILMGYYPPLLASPAPEVRLTVNAYKSLQEL